MSHPFEPSKSIPYPDETSWTRWQLWLEELDYLAQDEITADDLQSRLNVRPDRIDAAQHETPSHAKPHD
jgi:hypothetical protein